MINPFHRVTPEALLSHMAQHNRSHLKELEELAGQLEGDAAAALNEAIAAFRSGNDSLDRTVEILKKE